MQYHSTMDLGRPTTIGGHGDGPEVRREMSDVSPQLPNQFSVRTSLCVGDIGRITAMHGEMYGAEYGWDHTFEAYVGEYLSRFARDYGSNPRERIWIAERRDEEPHSRHGAVVSGAIAGCIAIVEVAAGVAQLRWFIVSPESRGSGLGRTLLQRAIDFSRDAGYGRIVLDTVSDLTAAARLYHAAGFRLAAETRGVGWGSEVTEQRYELLLSDDRTMRSTSAL